MHGIRPSGGLLHSRTPFNCPSLPGSVSCDAVGKASKAKLNVAHMAGEAGISCRLYDYWCDLLPSLDYSTKFCASCHRQSTSQSTNHLPIQGLLLSYRQSRKGETKSIFKTRYSFLRTHVNYKMKVLEAQVLGELVMPMTRDLDAPRYKPPVGAKKPPYGGASALHWNALPCRCQ